MAGIYTVLSCSDIAGGASLRAGRHVYIDKQPNISII